MESDKEGFDHVSFFWNIQAFVNAQPLSTTNTNMNVMGQLLDKAKRTIPNGKSSTNALPIRIVELEAKIENRPTVLDEKSSAVLKYRTPHFR